MYNENNISKSKRVALTGVMVALSMLLSYLETLIPLNIGIPGVKLGLANVVVIALIEKLPFGNLFLISTIRVLLSALLFGNSATLLFSVSGAVLSLIVMFVLKRSEKFSSVGISIAGGVSHNIGQLLVAAFLSGSMRIVYYIPALLLSGIITGLIIGIFGAYIGKRLKEV
ncbi:MAG: Gx transporter family protein [Lachnospiraceae bacterium]|nr:Gx transporter family protein [Lachnospiraceae bacterium]